MRLYRLKNSVKTGVCVLFALGFTAVFWLMGKFQLPTGESQGEYYLYSASSNAQTRETVDATEVFSVVGESKGYRTQNAEEFVSATLKSLRAEVLFFEEIGGVKSYYCYSPRMGKATILYGEPVNLHIAVQGNSVQIGSPVIFGGY